MPNRTVVIAAAVSVATGAPSRTRIRSAGEQPALPAGHRIPLAPSGFRGSRLAGEPKTVDVEAAVTADHHGIGGPRPRQHARNGAGLGRGQRSDHNAGSASGPKGPARRHVLVDAGDRPTVRSRLRAFAATGRWRAEPRTTQVTRRRLMLPATPEEEEMPPIGGAAEPGRAVFIASRIGVTQQRHPLPAGDRVARLVPAGWLSRVEFLRPGVRRPRRPRPPASTVTAAASSASVGCPMSTRISGTPLRARRSSTGAGR